MYFDSVKTMDLKHHIKWSLIGGIIAKVLGICATIILAKYLSQSTYGQWSLIKSIIMALSVFTTAGVTHFINWKIIVNQSIRVHHLIAIPLFISLVLSVIYILFRERLDTIFILHGNLFFYALAPLIVYSIFVMRQSVLAGSEKFRNRAFSEISVSAVFIMLVIGLIFSEWQTDIVTLLILSFLISYVLGLTLSYSFEKKESTIFKNIFLLIRDDRREYGFIVLNELAYAISTLIIASMLAGISFDTYAEYSLSQQFYLLLIYVPANLYPILLNYFKRGNTIPKFKTGVILFLAFLATAMTIILGILSDRYLGYQNLRIYFIFMFFLAGLNILRESRIQMVRAQGRNSRIFYSELARHITIILLLGCLEITVSIVILIQIIGTAISWLLLIRRR